MAPILTRLGQSFGFGASGDAVLPPISATGGSTVENGGWKYHVFNGNGPFSIAAGTGGTVEYVVQAGGGGGGNGKTLTGANNHYAGGGGGAGGLRTGSFTVTGGESYTISVGTGGAGRANTPDSPTSPAGGVQGSPSAVDGPGAPSYIFATGGGGGENRISRGPGGQPGPGADALFSGGCGGGTINHGADQPTTPNSSFYGGLTVASPDGISPTVQGYRGGGNGDNNCLAAGGGGGTGGVGGNVPDSPNERAGNGGGGAQTGFPGPVLAPLVPGSPNWATITGTNGHLGGGGGGGTKAPQNHQRGIGGGGATEGGLGGAGGTDNENGAHASARTGSGGGGGANNAGPGNSAGVGGDGSAGIVMFRYSTS